jgi:hypothetical protein
MRRSNFRRRHWLPAVKRAEARRAALPWPAAHRRNARGDRRGVDQGADGSAWGTPARPSHSTTSTSCAVGFDEDRLPPLVSASGRVAAFPAVATRTLGIL